MKIEQTGMAGPNILASSVYSGKTPEQILQMLYGGGFTQEGVNALYAARGLLNPPTVPSEFIGGKPGAGRARSFLFDASGNRINSASARDFLNSFGTTAVDPYRVRSGISNLAGGLLNGVGSYVGGPVWQAFTGIADAGNRALGNNDGTSYTDGRRSGADLAGAAIGAIAGSLNGPGSYGANNPSSGADPTGGAPGTQAGPTSTGGFGNIFGGGMGTGTSNWPDWINLGGQLLGSYFQGQGAKDASNAQIAASRDGLAEIKRQYDQSRTDQLPWLNAGTAALGRLQDPNAFTASPGYGFVKREALGALDNSASARGGLFSGNAARALQDRAANLGSMEYNNWFNQQSNLAGLGQTSAQSLGGFGANAANNSANLLSDQGNARASGIAGQTNAITGGIGDFLSWYNRRRQYGGG